MSFGVPPLGVLPPNILQLPPNILQRLKVAYHTCLLMRLAACVLNFEDKRVIP